MDLQAGQRLRRALLLHGEPLVEAIVRERGFPVASVRRDLAYLLIECDAAATLARLWGDRQPLASPDEEVLCVLPYNVSFWALIPAANCLLAGNRVRLKLPSGCPDTARLFWTVLSEAFGPDSVVLDQRPGPEILRDGLRNPACRAVCLYGAEATALAYRDEVARFGKKFIFEGPGNNPYILLPDAPAEVVERVLQDKFLYFSGQGCFVPERLFVPETLYEDVLGALLDGMRGVTVGDPADPATDVGPIRHPGVLARMARQVEDAVAQGARVLTGGTPEGPWMPPTLVAGLRPGMAAMREEVFGPVLYVGVYKSLDEAVALAQDSPYGLGAVVWG
ncbi:MAG: aldehyde dehydrogenase family protein, partial [Clostridia bacterium]|nr:aldehyde dehydrogenase family protein [Clostridia bacterium]